MVVIRLTCVLCVLVYGRLVTSTITESEMNNSTSMMTAAVVPSPAVICQFDPREASAKISAIDAAFARSQMTDVIFLIDRSESIRPKAFDNTKATVRTLMEYLMLRRRLYIHGDYTRVAVVSFGFRSMIEFDGISSDSDTVHACNIDDRLHDLELGTSGRNTTNLESALTTAEKIFTSNTRTDVAQILWIFHDGESSNVTGTLIRKLKHNGVTVFSAGIGKKGIGWMDTVAKEKHVQSFAEDRDHYACAEHWTSIIETEMENGRPNSEKEVDDDPLYVTDNTYSSGECVLCPGSKRCVCDVTTRQYECALVDVANTGHLVIIIVLTIVVVSIVLIVVLVVVCCRNARWCRHWNKTPVIPPRVVPRKNVDDGLEWGDEPTSIYYNVKPEQMSSAWVEQSAEHTQIYIVPMEQAIVQKGIEEKGDDSCMKQSDDSYTKGGADSCMKQRDDSYTKGGADSCTKQSDDSFAQHRSTSNIPLPCETPPWYLAMNRQVETPDAALTSSVDTKGDGQKPSSTSPNVFKYDYVYEQILTGPMECRRRVMKLADGHGVRGLLIYDTANARHWAATPGFLLPPAEIATFQTILDEGGASNCKEVKAADKIYTVDRHELSDLHLHATRGDGDHLWVARQGDYIIVGVAAPQKGKDCEDAVFDVQRNLHKKALEDKTEPISSPDYVSPNTWTHDVHNKALEGNTESINSPLYLTPNTWLQVGQSS